VSGADGFDEEAHQVLEEVAGEGSEEPTEIAVPGTLLYVKALIQCGSCLAVGRETVLTLERTNSEDLEDLTVKCELCSQESMRETNCPTVIRFNPYVGEECEEVDAGLELLEKLETTDAGQEGQPFAGVEPVDMPLPVKS